MIIAWSSNQTTRMFATSGDRQIPTLLEAAHSADVELIPRGNCCGDTVDHVPSLVFAWRQIVFGHYGFDNMGG